MEEGGGRLAAVEAVSTATTMEVVSAAEAQQKNNDNDPTAVIVTEHVSSSFNWIHPILCFGEKLGYKLKGISFFCRQRRNNLPIPRQSCR
jgi:hypothetical protein